MCQIIMIVSLTKRYILFMHKMNIFKIFNMFSKHISLRQRNNHDDLTHRSEHIQENIQFGVCVQYPAKPYLATGKQYPANSYLANFFLSRI